MCNSHQLNKIPDIPVSFLQCFLKMRQEGRNINCVLLVRPYSKPICVHALKSIVHVCVCPSVYVCTCMLVGMPVSNQPSRTGNQFLKFFSKDLFMCMSVLSVRYMHHVYAWRPRRSDLLELEF